MRADEALELLLRSYIRYYDVERDNVLQLHPFMAAAEFHSCEKGYFMVKRAVISEAESHEYIYFYAAESLNAAEVAELSRLAWERGLANVEPNSTHRNSDVAVVFIAANVDKEAFKAVKKLRFYKGYKGGFHGYSHLKAIAFDTSTGELAANSMGSHMKKLFAPIRKKIKD